MMRLKFAENMKEATTFIEQGRILKKNVKVYVRFLLLLFCELSFGMWILHHPLTVYDACLDWYSCLAASLTICRTDIRVGPDTITDPAFLVTRNMEDFVTWVDTSKIKRKVAEYNDQLDDYDLLN